MVILQKFVADVAFINTMCRRPFLVCQGWDLAQGIELQKPFWLFVKLIPQARSGVFDGHLVQSVLDAFLVENYPGALGKGAKPVHKIRTVQKIVMKVPNVRALERCISAARVVQGLACKPGSVPCRQQRQLSSNNRRFYSHH